MFQRYFDELRIELNRKSTASFVIAKFFLYKQMLCGANRVFADNR